MLAALETLEVLTRTSAGSLRLNRNPFDAWALPRENRGTSSSSLVRVTCRSSRRAGATGSAWVELITESTDEIAIRMTGRMIASWQPTSSASSRPSTVPRSCASTRGCSAASTVTGCWSTATRGAIDVELLSAAAIDVLSVRSHMDVPDPASDEARPLFGRDCLAYQLRTPGAWDHAAVWVDLEL